MIRASNNERINMAMTAMGMTARNFPIIPAINSKGEKATMVEHYAGSSAAKPND